MHGRANDSRAPATRTPPLLLPPRTAVRLVAVVGMLLTLALASRVADAAIALPSGFQQTTALSGLTHAGAAVHEQSHGDRGIVAGEEIDRLRCAVLDDPKRISGKVGHVGGSTVSDGHVHDDELRRRREDWSSFLSRLRPTAGIHARDRQYRHQHNRSNHPPSAHDIGGRANVTERSTLALEMC